VTTSELDNLERMEFLADRTMRLICAAMDRQPEQASQLIEEMGERYGHDGMYGVCCALAETVRQWVWPEVKRGDGTLTGDMLAIEKLPSAREDRATDWAVRFVAAYVNGDGDNTTALFFGQLDDQELILGGVIALVAMVGDIGRQKEAEARLAEEA